HQLCRRTKGEFRAYELRRGQGRDYRVQQVACPGDGQERHHRQRDRPGLCENGDEDQIPKDVMDKIVESIPVGRLAEPSEIARAVVFLADEKSAYITGQVMGINGGFYM